MTRASCVPPAQNAMTALQRGFDGGPTPDGRMEMSLWRVGRWLRVQGASRPETLHRAEDGLVVVNGQIFRIDPYGDITNLSVARPRHAPGPAASAQG